MNELALFAGAGGGILGGHLLGWRTVCAVEFDEYARSVLIARQNDGCLPPFPIWDDVRTFDGHPWRGLVDVVSGGFPCQDISCAGKGAGITGEKSGLWTEMARIIGEVRPRFVFVENSPMLVGRGLAVVLGDLASMGYNARWGIVGAHHAGAPHKRDRIWIRGELADSIGEQNDEIGRTRELGRIAMGRDEQTAFGNDAEAGNDCACGFRADVADAERERRRQMEQSDDGGPLGERAAVAASDCGFAGGRTWWGAEPELGRVAHGVAHRVDRLRCIGNGQVPAAAALAWRILGGDQ